MFPVSEPGFFSTEATEPSEIESPIEGTATETSAAGAAVA